MQLIKEPGQEDNNKNLLPKVGQEVSLAYS